MLTGLLWTRCMRSCGGRRRCGERREGGLVADGEQAIFAFYSMVAAEAAYGCFGGDGAVLVARFPGVSSGKTHVLSPDASDLGLDPGARARGAREIEGVPTQKSLSAPRASPEFRSESRDGHVERDLVLVGVRIHSPQGGALKGVGGFPE